MGGLIKIAIERPVAVLALILLTVLFGIVALRNASVAVIVLTICKVFLFDMSNLEGILRAASFIGLGVTLVGIGYFYQKLMVPRAAASGDRAPDAGAASP